MITAGTLSVFTRGFAPSFNAERSADRGTVEFLPESALMVVDIVGLFGEIFSSSMETTFTASIDGSWTAVTEDGDGFVEEVELCVNSFAMSFATSSNCIFRVSRSINDLSTPALLASKT